jgi:gliding motility-associated-like protein
LKYLLLLICICSFATVLYGKGGTHKKMPDDPDCVGATLLAQTDNYCSGQTEYATNTAKTYAWFKFIALKTDVSIVATGFSMVGPTVQLFIDCSGTQVVGTVTTSNNVTTFYKGGLIVGNTYYVRISSTGAPGVFKLCLNNYAPINLPGQDCATASALCNLQGFSQASVAGGGLNNNEAAGTCLDGAGSASESNSVWYKWRATNNGTMVFTITPNKTTDDIDFVIYDLGVSGDCANVQPSNAIRCAAGHGVDNIACPLEPIYYKTGLDMDETDIEEGSGCGTGQNGKLKFLTMETGHVYGLLINNFSSQNNGFTMDFKDQKGRSGTGTIAAPTVLIEETVVDTCTVNHKFSFKSNTAGFTNVKWDFGTDASTTQALTGEYNVTYTVPGTKTITLHATSLNGCEYIDTKTVDIGKKPISPVIKSNKANFCINDTIVLSAAAQAGYTYHWAGPNNFAADGDTVRVPVTSTAQAGQYQLTIPLNPCPFNAGSITVPAIFDAPVAAFTASPKIPSTIVVNTQVSFLNQSTKADHYLWDFGDGSTSTDDNPVHEYVHKGTYKVTLTAYEGAACNTSLTEGDLHILTDVTMFIPNTFTPNGDGTNDTFTVRITNISTYLISVFNRYGAMVYQGKDMFTGWDGNYKGKPVPTGVYYYTINAKDIDGEEVKNSGSITLLR